MNRSITIFIAIVLSVAIANAETQTFGVNGNFICPVEPEKAANVTVKLADVEDSVTSTSLGTATSDKNGAFSVTGKRSGVWVGKIQPYIHVYHDCDDGKTPCQRHFVLQLPKSYVSSEGTKSAPFNLGVINLEISYPKEDRNCLGTLSGK